MRMSRWKRTGVGLQGPCQALGLVIDGQQLLQGDGLLPVATGGHHTRLQGQVSKQAAVQIVVWPEQGATTKYSGSASTSREPS